MYLTRITLSAPQALQLKLLDSYAWHQRLWEAFPGRDGEKRDFLSRIEIRPGAHEALLLSPTQPQPQQWGQWQSKSVTPGFLERDHYRFDLRANPVVSRPVREADGCPRPRGRRQPIVQQDQLLEWIQRQAERAGFAVDPAQLEIGAPVRQPFHKKGCHGVHTRVDFRGMLSVHDGDAFQTAFREGIGPAKAFGFGMLMLQPIS